MQTQRSARTQACREQVHQLTQCQGAVRLAEQRVAGIERDAGRAVLKAEELARRFGLTGEVRPALVKVSSGPGGEKDGAEAGGEDPQ